MSEKTYTLEQLETAIRTSVIMTKDFLSDKDMSGAELYESHKDHILSFVVPEPSREILKEALTIKSEEIVSHYPDWLEEEPEHPWHDKVAKKLCNSLSDTQRVILKTIIDNNNKASHDVLKKAIIAANIKWTNNLTLGGSLGGLSRKCVYRYETPYVYGWNEDDDSYFIVPEALPLIEKYLA